MKIGIVGIGLIGGSILKRLAKTDEMFVNDKDPKVLADAIQDNNAKELLDFNNLDMLIIALPPNELLQYLKENADKLKNILITDVCGVKSCVQQLCDEYGLNYFGMHPMAGREVGGYYNSLANLFEGANLVVTGENIPPQIAHIINVLGFGRVVACDSQKHDKIIAYTSQLCHIVSNAFGKTPTSKYADGFTGGSFEDLTRVGELDVPLWIGLFDKNRANLIEEIDVLIANLVEYKIALATNDDQKLAKLLSEGVKCLKEIE